MRHACLSFFLLLTAATAGADAPPRLDRAVGGKSPPSPKAYLASVETRAIPRVIFEREMNDFDKLMAAMTVARVAGGGFRFVALEPRSFVASCGFRAGDVVRKIGGETISSLDDAGRAYARLRAGASFAAEVERGAEHVTLRIELH